MERPDIPLCINNEPHNFLPLNKRSVYCTKCAAHVKFVPAKEAK